MSYFHHGTCYYKDRSKLLTKCVDSVVYNNVAERLEPISL